MIRFILFWGFTGASWYMAATYRSVTLTVISAAVTGFGILLLLLSCYLCFKSRAAFLRRQDVIRQGETYHCECEIQNRSYILNEGVCVSLQIRGAFRQKAKARVCGRLGGRETIRLGADMTFFRCGCYQIRQKRIRIAEPLAIFSCWKRGKEQMQVIVLPPDKIMQIVNLQTVDAQNETVQMSLDNRALSQEEIRQVREYQPGDALRHIHWNLSARSDKLWIKEYERETETGAVVYLTNEESAPPTKEGLEAFYMLAAALICGLLQTVSSAEVIWRNASAQKTECIVNKQQGLGELFLKLYQFDDGYFLAKPQDEDLFRSDMPVLRLDYNRTLYKGAQSVFRFSENAYEDELEQRTFIV